MSCPVLGCDLPNCHDDLDEGPRPGRWDDDTPEPVPLQRVADPLGRVYTPDWLADSMVKIAAMVQPQPIAVVDPSCGGGALLRAARRRWPGLSLPWMVGMDVDPGAAGLGEANDGQLTDCLAGHWPDGKGSVVLMNPPYIPAAWGHIKRALRTEPDVLVVLLPLPWAGHKAGRDLLYGDEPAKIIPVVGRPWMRLREAALFVWTPRTRSPLVRAVYRPAGVRPEP